MMRDGRGSSAKSPNHRATRVTSPINSQALLFHAQIQSIRLVRAPHTPGVAWGDPLDSRLICHVRLPSEETASGTAVGGKLEYDPSLLGDTYSQDLWDQLGPQVQSEGLYDHRRP